MHEMSCAQTQGIVHPSALLSIQLASHKLKPYLLFAPSDAAAVRLVIHSVLILYYYANNKQAETFQR